ncbi:MAG: hypothetical protein CTY23_08710 [Methylomonas sp.]|nr:MAG: hypothetical protein CTY23_08710 [Methylomonas sp.]
MPLACALLAWVSSVLPQQTLNRLIDDTLVLRHSQSAPGSAVRHDHARTTNCPDWWQTQCWASVR